MEDFKFLLEVPLHQWTASEAKLLEYALFVRSASTISPEDGLRYLTTPESNERRVVDQTLLQVWNACSRSPADAFLMALCILTNTSTCPPKVYALMVLSKAIYAWDEVAEETRQELISTLDDMLKFAPKVPAEGRASWIEHVTKIMTLTREMRKQKIKSLSASELDLPSPGRPLSGSWLTGSSRNRPLSSSSSLLGSSRPSSVTGASVRKSPTSVFRQSSALGMASSLELENSRLVPIITRFDNGYFNHGGTIPLRARRQTEDGGVMAAGNNVWEREVVPRSPVSPPPAWYRPRRVKLLPHQQSFVGGQFETNISEDYRMKVKTRWDGIWDKGTGSFELPPPSEQGIGFGSKS